MSNETPAGRMAREWPELDAREMRALLSENAHREYGKTWPDCGAATIRARAEDARNMAWAVFHHGPGSPAYWAALP